MSSNNHIDKFNGSNCKSCWQQLNCRKCKWDNPIPPGFLQFCTDDMYCGFMLLIKMFQALHISARYHLPHQDPWDCVHQAYGWWSPWVPLWCPHSSPSWWYRVLLAWFGCMFPTRLPLVAVLESGSSRWPNSIYWIYQCDCLMTLLVKKKLMFDWT